MLWIKVASGAPTISGTVKFDIFYKISICIDNHMNIKIIQTDHIYFLTIKKGYFSGEILHRNKKYVKYFSSVTNKKLI